MSSGSVKKLSAVICAALTVVFIIVLYFTAPTIGNIPETQGVLSHREFVLNADETYTVEERVAEIGKDVTAVRISDLGDIGNITKVNYVPDTFVSPDSIPDNLQIVDLSKPFDFAEKGTLIFVVMNLDAESEDFKEQSEKLSEYKIGDYWMFTLSLPKIFNASNVYCGSNLIARNGDIENYDFINYTTSYDKKTERYSPKVERTTLELRFYTRRQALNQYQLITVHYQSSGTVCSAITDYPLLGKEDTVGITCANSQNLLIAFAVLAAAVCAILIVLSILKRTKGFVNAIIWIAGIFLMLFPKFMLGQSTVAPLVWMAFSWSAVFLTLGGVLFTLGINIGKVPTKYLFPALMCVGWITAFICPFVPFGAATVLRILFTVIKGIGAVALSAFAFFAAFRKNDGHPVLEISIAAIVSVAVGASIFLPAVFPVYIYSMFWICVFTVILTFIGVFKVFKDTEKANEYLTTNLHLEVDRQLKDIRAVIAERDDLLRFVSHDLKKPLQSSAPLLDTLIERERDTEQKKALRIVKQNNSRVVGNLSEIGSYTRFNYIAEPSQITDLREVCASLFEFHEPDCNANGIVLKNLVEKHYKVFVKRQGLENAVSNIILNAIEHANCKTITLSAKAEKNRVVLCIADDGKGIAEGIDVFTAYVSEKSQSSGVGLYICKNIIESMSGELHYESKQGNTVFYISMLKA